MDFQHGAQTTELVKAVEQFIRNEIEPREGDYRAALAKSAWSAPAVVEDLKVLAREAGLWNLFLPKSGEGGRSNLDYAPLAEAMGHSALAPEVFNCNAPDTGNAELLLHYGSAEQRRRWLTPLLDGSIRSAFCMTEPSAASSDATNMVARAVIDGDEVVVTGRKWWSTGVGHPHCKFVIFMGVTDPEAPPYQRHSMVLVPLNTPGVTVERMLTTFGYFDEPYGHGEVSFTDVRLPLSAVIGGPGQGFEIAQGRLGPGRIHHCMRTIGLAERALGAGCRRSMGRTAFGERLADLGGNRERIAHARIAINQARLLVLHTAWLIDTHGISGARSEVSQIKAQVPRMAQEVIDMAIQLHGGAGLSEDFGLARAFALVRSLRFADGPDEVHLNVVARHELRSYEGATA